MDDPRNILQPDDELSEEQLKKYLSGKSSADESHLIEKQIADSDFVNDAVEGLQSFSSGEKMDHYIQQLNKNLQQQLKIKKVRKEKRKVMSLSWTIVAVIVVLLLCILAYIIIKIQQHDELPDKIMHVAGHMVPEKQPKHYFTASLKISD